jgi:hypothetical protein
VNQDADGCARASSFGRARGGAAPLPAGTTDPVLCSECGNVFGRGAEAGTVCPYCGGPLHPLPGASEVVSDPSTAPPAGEHSEDGI